MFTLAILSPSAASGSVVSVTGQSGHWALTRPLLLSTLRNCQPETGGGPLLGNLSTRRVFTLSSLLNNSILVWWSPRLLLCGHGYSWGSTEEDGGLLVLSLWCVACYYVVAVLLLSGANVVMLGSRLPNCGY